jgi:hypothetical protein
MSRLDSPRGSSVSVRGRQPYGVVAGLIAFAKVAKVKDRVAIAHANRHSETTHEGKSEQQFMSELNNELCR